MMEESAQPGTELKAWWLVRGASKTGPYSRGELRQQAGSGELLATDQVWKEGLTHALPVTTVTGPLPASTGPTPVAAPELERPAHNPYSPPQSPEAAPDTQDATKPASGGWLFAAKLMLGFAIMGFAAAFLIIAYFILPGSKPWFVNGRLLADATKVALFGFVAYKSCLKKATTA